MRMKDARRKKRARTVEGTGKQAVNVSVSRKLLADARALDINLSATLEDALAERVRQLRRESWTSRNRKAIEAYNEEVATAGSFGDAVRRF
jgi:antitoxin CcdA